MPPENMHVFKAGFDCQHVIDFKITSHCLVVDIVAEAFSIFAISL